MDTLFEKLDQLSSPLGSLLDAVLNRLAPHTTASACGGNVWCGTSCSNSRCSPNGATGRYSYWADSQQKCFNRQWSIVCLKACNC